MNELLIAYTDGAARGNPGPAGAGVLIVDLHDVVVEEALAYLGEATNNIAEYQALLLALDKLEALNAKQVIIRSDSQLIVRQLCGEYRVKNEGLRPLFLEAKARLRNFESVTIEHIPREQNKAADKLANQAIDEAGIM
jgi:ribonuclease HI